MSVTPATSSLKEHLNLPKSRLNSDPKDAEEHLASSTFEGRRTASLQIIQKSDVRRLCNFVSSTIPQFPPAMPNNGQIKLTLEGFSNTNVLTCCWQMVRPNPFEGHKGLDWANKGDKNRTYPLRPKSSMALSTHHASMACNMVLVSKG